MPGLSDVQPEEPIDVSTWSAVPLRTYGSLSGEDGQLVLEAPIDAAVLSDGGLVVADVFACTLTIVDRPSGKVRDVWGACGDGPGEFRQISAVTVWKDSLFVYDQRRREVVVLSPTGDEVRRLPVQFLRASDWALTHFDVLDDSTFVAATEGLGEAYVGFLDRRSGKFDSNILAKSPAIANEFAGGGVESLRRMGGMCLPPDHVGPSRTIVVVSDWASEGVGFDPNHRGELWHYLYRSRFSGQVDGLNIRPPCG